MPKKTLIIIIVAILIIALGFGVYFGWIKKDTEKSALEKIGEAAEKATENAAKGVLPSIQTNPLEDKPDINPADKANPFKNIKTNPFE
ncbi:MAG: hypothetical protein V1705_00700 [bacterium]